MVRTASDRGKLEELENCERLQLHWIKDLILKCKSKKSWRAFPDFRIFELDAPYRIRKISDEFRNIGTVAQFKFNWMARHGLNLEFDQITNTDMIWNMQVELENRYLSKH